MTAQLQKTRVAGWKKETLEVRQQERCTRENSNTDFSYSSFCNRRKDGEEESTNTKWTGRPLPNEESNHQPAMLLFSPVHKPTCCLSSPLSCIGVTTIFPITDVMIAGILSPTFWSPLVSPTVLEFWSIFTRRREENMVASSMQFAVSSCVVFFSYIAEHCADYTALSLDYLHYLFSASLSLLVSLDLSFSQSPFASLFRYDSLSFPLSRIRLLDYRSSLSDTSALWPCKCYALCCHTYSYIYTQMSVNPKEKHSAA